MKLNEQKRFLLHFAVHLHSEEYQLLFIQCFNFNTKWLQKAQEFSEEYD